MSVKLNFSPILELLDYYSVDNIAKQKSKQSLINPSLYNFFKIEFSFHCTYSPYHCFIGVKRKQSIGRWFSCAKDLPSFKCCLYLFSYLYPCFKLKL